MDTCFVVRVITHRRLAVTVLYHSAVEAPALTPVVKSTALFSRGLEAGQISPTAF